ncbi:MAG TPA: lysylphosphatidylglycerol synthase transmembrane domain-containing protein [Ktedonobacteraceae bacterium]|nr:lysylphosphatidylglycerol synthase transmembrane domain-containing protein [Ktedonobacteraceae bacterium]
MKRFFNTLGAKILVGLLIGVGLLFLVSRFANFPVAIRGLQRNLATPHGIFFALLSGFAFLLAFSLRGLRWKLFLNPIGDVSSSRAIRLVLSSTFLNFLLPFSGGEIAKPLMLKRIAAIPISKSLPTVAIDRSLDLLPALFILVLVPLLGIRMDIKLWLVLGTVSGLLICLVFFAGIAIWKRAAAIALLRKITYILPRAFREKVETFAAGFVDSLLMGLSRPHIFIPAVLLTCLAISCDSLFAMFAFWVIGFPISFGTTLFGYTLFNMFFIFPTPPGQVGSNEAIGLLIFAGLLHLPSSKVIAMFLFSHPWAALLMCASGMICLKTLGLTASTAIRAQATQAPIKESPLEREEVHLSEQRVLPSPGLIE